MFNQVTYNVVIDRLAAYAQGHLLLKAFTHGTLSKMVEALEEDDYPLMHVTPASVSYQAGERSFTLDVVFADIPRMVEDREEYEREIISDCIQLAEDLLAEIRNGGVIFGRDVTLEENIEVTPFIADYAHTLTGVTLSITLNFPYNWSACDIPADWSVGGSGSSSPAPSYGLLLKVNSNPNAVQSILDLVNGTNVTIEDLGDGRVRINSTGGGGGSVNWGSILGTLSNQTDLQNALNLKADVSSLAAVATSGDYNDLTNTPTIPDELRDLVDCFYSSPQQNDVLLFDSPNNIFTNGQLGAVAYSNDYNDLSNTPTLPPVIGDMTKAEYDTDDDGVVDSAERIQIVVRNSTGSALLKGKVVYLSGATGNRPNAILADASTEATSSKTIGIVIEDIANNSDGYIAVNGTLHDLDTSMFADGDTLWLSETAGDVQANTPPAEPAHAVFIGYVARSHPNLGRVVIQIQNGYELNELHGVDVPSPTINDYLYYDGSLWKSRALNSTIVVNASTIPASDVSAALNFLSGQVQGKVTSNAAITGATATKITYDSKGLVTGSSSLLAADLPSHTHTASQISDSSSVGQSLITIPNPSAISYLRINADNSVSALTLAQLKADLGLNRVVLASDVSTTAVSTALVDVTGLSFPIVAGNTYKFTAYLVHTASVANVGLKWAVNADVAVANITYRTLQNGGVVTAFFIHHANALNSASTNSGATQSNHINTIEGILVANNTGTAIIRFGKSQANAGTLTCKAGSYIEYETI